MLHVLSDFRPLLVDCNVAASLIEATLDVMSPKDRLRFSEDAELRSRRKANCDARDVALECVFFEERSEHLDEQAMTCKVEFI